MLADAAARLRSQLLFEVLVAARLAAEEHLLLGVAVRGMMYRSCCTLQREEQGGTAESPK